MTDTTGGGVASAAGAPLDDDPIVAEVRVEREAFARAANCDLGCIVANVRRIEAEERARGRVLISPPGPASAPAEA